MAKTKLALVAGALLVGCADPLEEQIERLAGGGAGADEARIQLNLAKKTAIPPLIRAFADRDASARARIEIAGALYRLYVREADERILAALIGGLEDPDAAVRAGVARALGDMRLASGVGPLIDRLEREDDDGVQLEILVALEVIGIEGYEGNVTFYSWIETDKMTPIEKERFTGLLQRLVGKAAPDSLRLKTEEWLEVLADERATAAQELALKADLQGAEGLFLSALELAPTSKNVNQKLGRFYYENGQREKGLEILAAHGMVAVARRLSAVPEIDGVLAEPAWRGIEPLTEQYQCIHSLRAYPVEGETEIYLGYRGNSLYVAMRGYEDATEDLVAGVTERDGDVYRDDSIDLYIDANLDARSYYQFMINSLGTVTDARIDRGKDRGWNAACRVATAVAAMHWTVEIEIPAAALHGSAIRPGGAWGFNAARARMADAGEYGQWVPTYGSAHRPDRFGLLVFVEE